MAETLAGMFWNRVEASGDRPAELVQRGERWETLTWSEVGAIVREVALGLLALGVERGERVALMSASRAEWVHADFAILSTGCVTVPIYATYPPELIADIVNDAGARILIVENMARLALVLEARVAMPGLERVVVIEGESAEAAGVLSWKALRELGRDESARLGPVFVDRVAAIAPGDIATIVYTSGTTGVPKGVVQTHANHVAALESVARIPGVAPGDVHLLFLPLAHSFARLEAFVGVHRGLVTAFSGSLDRLADHLREVRPHFIFAVPRVFEKVHARIIAGVAVGPAWRRRFFAWAIGVGREVSRRQRAHRPIPPGLRLRHRIAERLVFAQLQQALGGRLRFAVSGGAPLSPDLAEFFHAAGILIVEGYGLTETCPVATFNRVDQFKFGTVGRPVPGVEVMVAPDGELLVRGPNVAGRGYWRRPEDTAAAFGADGWFHTGDIGWIDEEGFVVITDRKKELIVTSGGINLAPQPVENLLRLDPLVSQAMVHGDRRPYPTALVTLDHEVLARFARELGILDTDHARLVREPRVVERVQRIVDATNQHLASYARIKRFAVLPGDFTEEGGELTPTQKIRRKVVAEKYCAVLESLYR